MANSKLIEQVSRLVSNLLAAGKEVYVPGVGTLYTERLPVKHLSKRMVVPPHRIVMFSSQQRGLSLLDEIARALHEAVALRGDATQTVDPQAVFDCWFESSYVDEVLTIGGVGTLKMKEFKMDEAFDRRINPQGYAPVRLQSVRRFDWALWFGVAAIVIAAGFGGYEFLLMQPEVPEVQTEIEIDPSGRRVLASVESGAITLDPTSSETAADAAAPTVGDAASGTAATTSSTAASEGTSPQSAAASTVAQTSGTPEAPASMISGMRYVVLGVFSTPENAARAVREATEKEPSMRCGVYRMGEKFLISPLASTDADACTRFITERAESFPGMWTYTAR